MRRFSKLVFSQGLSQIGKERAGWLAGVMAGQNRDLMLSARREAMAFYSRPRLGEIGCPTLIIAGSNDRAVPIHHAMMLHEGIAGSQLVVVEGADHALICTRADELMRVTDEFLGA